MIDKVPSSNVGVLASILLLVATSGCRSVVVSAPELEAVRAAEAFVVRNGYTSGGHPKDLPVQAAEIFDVFLSDQELIERRRGELESSALGVEDRGEGAYWVYFESIGRPGYPRIVAVENGEAIQVFHMSYGQPSRAMKLLPKSKAPADKSLDRVAGE